MATITIVNGFGISIDGKSAGSLEDALRNFPEFKKELWAATQLELRAAQQQARDAVTAAQQSEADKRALLDELAGLRPVADGEQDFETEVATRIAQARREAVRAKREAEIQRRVNEAMKV